ncbi:MAG: prolyl oligopeptidase family serine peptidase [Bacteroidetes bacterium]|nr:prolyl oligopeptidase family serine peptidase [Bacteroidota bacterium]
MKNATFLFLLLFFGMNTLMFAQVKPAIPPQYPVTKKVSQTDDYFGTKVNDPYRWLEDDKSQETADWVKQQNEVTQTYLSAIPFRNDLKARLTQLWNFPKMNAPVKQGDRRFYLANTGMQNQSVLYMMDDKNPKGVVVLDPNKLSTDGTIALSDFEVSHDGKYLAYTISRSGSDWNEIYVIDLKKMKIQDDVLKWVKFSGMAWQGKGFYYSRYDEPKTGDELTSKNENHKVYYHKLGTSQSKDQLIYENKDYPQRNYTASVTDDERFLLIYETESTSGNAMYFKNLKKEDKNFKVLFTGFAFDYEVIGNFGDSLLVRTNAGAPRYRLLLLDPETQGKETWPVFLDEDPKMVMESAHIADNYIVIKYLNNATNLLFVCNRNKELVDKIPLPALGTVSEFHSRQGDNDAFFSFTSFTYPTMIFQYNIKEKRVRLIHSPEVDFNPNDYETVQVFYEGMDGTSIPMFIVYKKTITKNGMNPTYLYGYGGFNISITPTFSVSRMVFLENGGILAIPNIRGGGELGEEWHLAGTKEKKQTVFNDFIAAAQYLITNQYTNPNKLAIAGGSNGGLLVGACMTQKPDLFKVALPDVGVLDMLRYHKFTIGWAWKTDYGCSDNSDEFKYLYKYSPLHNIKEGGKYPATLVTTSDHDDRVVPAHSFKFIATLQEKNKSNNPELIRIQTKAGHGQGKPTSLRIEEAADVWSFVFYNLGLDLKVKAKVVETEMDKKKKKQPSYYKDPVYQRNLPKKPPVAPATDPEKKPGSGK